jgi:outer membrane protein OmpA-like peptidoglycan-associated protein
VSYGNGIVSTAKKGSIGYHGMSSNVTRPFRNAPTARPFVATGMPTGRVGLNTTPQVLADGGVALGQRHFAPGGGPGNIYQSFINWITSTGEYGGMNAWKDYDELNDNTDYLYYDMAKLEELWQQYLSNNNLPGGLTWEAFLDWFYSYQTNNSLNDRYNSKIGNKDDWSLTAQLGLAYKFGFKKGAKKEPAYTATTVAPVQETATVAAEPKYATRIDTTWYDDVTYKEVPSQEKMEKNIYFEIRESEVGTNANINAIADFVKNHKNCKVSVTGYADKGTGTPAINKNYSQQRADRVTKALVKAGVPAAIITTKALGDTVQPFAENDKNRVVITVATGDGTKKEKVVTKKFRTKEVRYRVD